MQSLILPATPTTSVPLGTARLCTACDAIYVAPYCPACGARRSLDLLRLIDWTRAR